MSSEDTKAAVDSASEKAKASVRAAKDEASVATSKALHQSQDVAHDATDQASATASDLYGRAKEHVQGISDRLPDNAADAYRAGQRAYAQSSEHVGRHVAKQPIEALLLAGAIGYLVGWATSRS